VCGSKKKAAVSVAEGTGVLEVSGKGSCAQNYSNRKVQCRLSLSRYIGR